MASTVLDPTAVLIAEVIDGVDTSEPVKAYAQDPGTAGLDKLPAGVVGIPSLTRQGIEEAESQIGTDDWLISYPVEFFFALDNAIYTATQAVETLEAFVKAIDANQSLGLPTVMDTKVVNAEPVEVLDAARPMLVYSCRVQVLRLVQPS